MPFAPTRHTLEIICLSEGHIAPAGADWIHLAPVGDAWIMEGGIPIPAGIMSRYGEYAHQFEAERAGIDLARERGCGVVFVEAG